AGEAVVNMLAKGTTACGVLTKKAFENAIAVMMAFGGSSNTVLHLLDIPNDAGVDLTLPDFNRIGDKIPHTADLKLFCHYVRTDLDRSGCFSLVMQVLLGDGLLHGDASTITGKPVGSCLAILHPSTIPVVSPRPMYDTAHATASLPTKHGSMEPEATI